MTSALAAIASLTVVAVVSSLSPSAPAQLSAEAAITKAETVLTNLQAGKSADIVKELDAKLTEALPEQKLRGAWSELTSQFGAFKSINERREGPFQGRQAVELILAFEKETIVMRTVFDSDGKIGGLAFRPLANAQLPPKK